MKPSLSLILFTTTSGAGFGLFVMLVLTASLAPGAAPPVASMLTAGALALILVTAGLISSTLHLANPRNAVKAFNRFGPGSSHWAGPRWRWRCSRCSPPA